MTTSSKKTTKALLNNAKTLSTFQTAVELARKQYSPKALRDLLCEAQSGVSDIEVARMKLLLELPYGENTIDAIERAFSTGLTKTRKAAIRAFDSILKAGYRSEKALLTASRLFRDGMESKDCWAEAARAMINLLPERSGVYDLMLWLKSRGAKQQKACVNTLAAGIQLKQALDELLKIPRSEDWTHEAQVDAVRALKKRTEEVEVTTCLLRCIKKDDALAKVAGKVLFGITKRANLREPIQELLHSDHASIRQAAAHALEEFPEASEELLAQLSSTDNSLRKEAALSLKNRASSETVREALLCILLEDECMAAREAAATSLATATQNSIVRMALIQSLSTGAKNLAVEQSCAAKALCTAAAESLSTQITSPDVQNAFVVQVRTPSYDPKHKVMVEALSPFREKEDVRKALIHRIERAIELEKDPEEFALRALQGYEHPDVIRAFGTCLLARGTELAAELLLEMGHLELARTQILEALRNLHNHHHSTWDLRKLLFTTLQKLVEYDDVKDGIIDAMRSDDMSTRDDAAEVANYIDPSYLAEKLAA